MLIKAHNTLLRLAKADIAFYVLPPIMLLLFSGTLAQKYIGLYAAHKMFFASFIFWAGPVPLPGGYTLLFILTFALACKFFLKSKWSWKKAGIHLSHLGVLVLLLGGLMTALDAQESYMVIPEGGKTHYMYDYTHRELVVSSDTQIRRIPFSRIDDEPLPFDLKVLESCENCEIEKRAETDQDFGDLPLRAFAQFMALKPKPKDKDPEANLSGLSFTLFGLDDDNQNGLYIAFEAMPKPIKVTKNGKDYEIIFGKAQRTLPFALHLKEFTKLTYPGTDKAKDYISELEVLDGDLTWPARIEMNEPLRYKGYTFFQSSFERTEDTELTILSVVKNRGWLFPYIGTIIIALGLIMHLFIITGRAGKL
ncbi:MAG: cytochrome c biogenesis protein ResB [Alphaproteobacteria bacterium]|nr:cytochrome c biogenesis protein ResB [Alphaproteobacteria bacterium]